jgi:uncharacterized cupin superfamily protein
MPRITPAEFIVEDTPGTGGELPTRTRFIGEPGGLTQFGANIEELPPGAWSSIRHWHSAEDELVYVLEGEVTLVEGDTETLLRPGDAATFRAGDPVGHCLQNRSAATTRCLVVGTRAQVDRITYPDHDRVCHRDRSADDDVWTDLEGKPASNPYAGA